MLKTLYRWWPWLATWRCKMYLGLAILVLLAVMPMVLTYGFKFPLGTAVWSFLALPLGFASGRLIGTASNQRQAELVKGTELNGVWK